MLDERLKTRNESCSTSSPTLRHSREGGNLPRTTSRKSSSWRSVEPIESIILFFLAITLAACTDYVQQMDDGFDEWEQAQKQKTLSSSNQTEKSSSSVKLSSPAKSSNSTKTSSSEKASSSSKKAVSSSSEKKITSSFNYGTLKDDRDGQTYKTIVIGNQTWMAENLNYEIENSYKSICSITTAIHCTEYGKLYTWSAAMDSAGLFSTNGKGCGNKKTCNPSYPVRGICPVGWHIPEIKEFESLLTTVGGFSTAGIKLKTTDDWQPNGIIPGTDEYGFSAFPAGLRYDGSAYGLANNHAYFLTSTEYNDINEYTMQMHYNSADAEITPYFKIHAYSIRCIKDNISISNSSEEKISSSSNIVQSSSSNNTSWAYQNPTISYGEIVDDRDEQVYKTIVIDKQTWMAENLNYNADNSFCYNDSAIYCAKYGRLYRWGTAMDSAGKWNSNGKGCGFPNKECLPTYPIRGICPSNWHLPTNKEFETLINTVGGQTIAGEKLKSTSGWVAIGNGTDSYSFTALPSGYRGDGGYFNNKESNTYFWSSTDVNGGSAYYMRLSTSTSANVKVILKYNALSVRCVKD